MCANRILVHADVYEAFSAKLQARVSKLKVGDGLAERVDQVRKKLLTPNCSDIPTSSGDVHDGGGSNIAHSLSKGWKRFGVDIKENKHRAAIWPSCNLLTLTPFSLRGMLKARTGLTHHMFRK